MKHLYYSCDSCDEECGTNPYRRDNRHFCDIDCYKKYKLGVKAYK